MSLDLLTEDLSNVPTSMPLLKEGLADLEVTKMEVVQTADKTGERLSITLKTTTDTESVTGERIAKGFPVYHSIGLTPTEKYSVEAIKRACAAFVQAIGNKTMLPLEQHLGRVVRTKLVNSKERTDEKTGRTYEARTEIKTFVIPG